MPAKAGIHGRPMLRLWYFPKANPTARSGPKAAPLI